MPDREKVIKGLEEAEIMLKQAVDRGGEMAVIGAFKCLNRVTDAIILLKEQAKEIDEISDEYLNLGAEVAKMPKVVRCKQCENYEDCELAWQMCDPEWFCADGK